MSNVCCAMFNVLVKAPYDLLTKPPNLQWERFSHQVILSVGRFTSSSDIAQQTFDRHLTSFGTRTLFEAIPSSVLEYRHLRERYNRPALYIIRMKKLITVRITLVTTLLIMME